MKIASVRLGHSNNSSSSHSILLNATEQAVPSDGAPFGFGWDCFHLKSRYDKANYLAATLYSELTVCGKMSPSHAEIVVNEIVGVWPVDKDGYSVSVDHQSCITFPLSMKTGFIDDEFLREYVVYVRDDDRISIRGGNDNDNSRSRKFGGKRAPIDALPRESNPMWCRKNGDWWNLYNPQSGAKVRLTFKDNPAAYVPTHAPELVDLKITNWCKVGCKFCYQGSTKDGTPADRTVISKMTSAMKRAGVFEVALGGGEPTSHPDFADILCSLKHSGIIPNFTTHNISNVLCRGDEVVKSVKANCGGFAVSNPYDVGAIAKWNFDDGPKATLQVAMGCYSRKDVERALRSALALSVPVTLLGFKAHGRGASFRKHDDSWIVKFLKDESCPWNRFGADSLFVHQHKAALQKMGVSDVLMVEKEGSFSMYVDAVSGMAGPSSFAAPSKMHKVDLADPFCKFPYKE